MTIELAVFDIAGTTVEEHQAVYVALADAVRAAGGAPSDADIERWMGADKREAIGSLLSTSDTELIEKTFVDFRERLHNLYTETPPVPMAGVPEAFDKLRAAGIKIALTTGFDRDVTDGLLKVLGWDENVLDAVITVDDVPAGRPAPYMIHTAMQRTGVRDVRKVLTAGDTTRDVEAGTNAGASYVIGVLTGGQTAETLGAAEHTHILAGVREIPTLLGL
ncbi:phosphonatase-like hydrolase [Pseudonocardiaceae bacterium YIM PH 21723]|nr:phosphonatase-like hydrolase [Pseudonocardiaceae bacterium YIM PH 21723]